MSKVFPNLIQEYLAQQFSADSNSGGYSQYSENGTYSYSEDGYKMYSESYSESPYSEGYDNTYTEDGYSES